MPGIEAEKGSLTELLQRSEDLEQAHSEGESVRVAQVQDLISDLGEYAGEDGVEMAISNLESLLEDLEEDEE